MPDFVDFETANALLDWTELAEALRKGHLYPKAEAGDQLLGRGQDRMLIRAAWIDGLGSAVKTAVIHPGNADLGLGTFNGVMALFNDRTGVLDATIDFHLVTKWKTAADSLLAATCLARKDSELLLIVGAGTVARSLVEAYSSAFPGIAIAIWNRTPANARQFAEDLSPDYAIRVVEDLGSAVKAADIVTCATMSPDPVIRGEWLTPGTHLDLIGAFAPDMRETDDEALRKGRLFVDFRGTTIEHIGELMIPIRNGVISASSVAGDFYDLESGGFKRESADEISIFKNGGGAHLDLMTGRYILDKWNTMHRA